MKTKIGLNKFFDDDERNKGNGENVLIIDWANMVFRTVHISSFQAPDDTNFIYWKYMIINSLLSAIKKFSPSKVVIALEGRNNWRKDVYSEYKAQRKISREKSVIDFKKFFVILDDFQDQLKKAFTNFHVLKIDKCEADDTIAILAKKVFKDAESVTTISNDNDFIQLLENKNFILYNPIKKRNTKSINPKKDLELKIIMGDKSDNIPAIKPKTGIVTAEKFIKKGLSTILESDETIKKNYERNKRLIDFDFIPKDIELKIINEYNEYKTESYNTNKVWQFMIKNKIKKFADTIQSWNIYLKPII